MGHIGIVKPFEKRPPSQFAEAANLGNRKAFFGLLSMYELAMFRDNFKTSTWVLIGACVQGLLLSCLPPSLGLAPALVILGWRLTDTLLMTVGLKRNYYMDGVIPGKWSTHFPNQEGEYAGDPADSEVCVIVLAARSNHPLGMLAPGYRDIFTYFNANVASLEANPEEQGWLGMSGWLNAGDRSTGSEAMMIGYFKNVDYLHKFAHGTSHRNGWNWWNRTLKDHPYLSIMHEAYQVPKSSWESIYINYHPSGLAATTHAVRTKQDTSSPDKTTAWFSPIVEAQKGNWRSSSGRMGRSDGSGNVAYGDDPYVNT